MVPASSVAVKWDVWSSSWPKSGTAKKRAEDPSASPPVSPSCCPLRNLSSASYQASLVLAAGGWGTKEASSSLSWAAGSMQVKGHSPFQGIWIHKTVCYTWELHPKLLKEKVQWNEILWLIYFGSTDWTQDVSCFEDSPIAPDDKSLSSKLK